MLDGLLAVSICGLAFLVASTPARNSDLWLHLASGRALLQGTSRLGIDPFASTTQGILWVNPSWLSDVVLYQLFEHGGGRALVFAKAFLLAGLAGLFFAFRRRGTPAGVAALAAAIVVLALAPWLSLQPVLWSLLGVVLTLYLLERPGLREGCRAERARRQRWLLVPLFAVWANLDGWFVLGPILVGLYALGSALPYPPKRTAEGEKRLSGGVLYLILACLAACLVTPYHYHTLAWPSSLGLSHTEQVLPGDPLGQGFVVSSFAARFADSAVFRSPGGWAYYLLLAAGVVSFALRGRALHGGRLLVWLVLAAVSIYQARAIALFAVAAGPILALNVQDWLQARPLSEPMRRLRIAARGAGALAGLALLVLAWPGWLQPTPYQPRGWSVEPDASLVRLARRIQTWHEEGRFRPDRRALTFSPEVAHHLAWFCPAEKGFLDSRWPLFDRVADDFVQMRRCLLPSGASGPDDTLAPLLDAHAIDRILVHDPEWERTSTAYRCLLRGGSEWQLLAVEGGTALFGRREGNSASTWQPLDLRRAAYDPEPDRRAPLTAPRAPQSASAWEPFYRSRKDRSADREEAALYLIFFDLKAEQGRADLTRQWLLAQTARLAGAAPGSEAVGAISVLTRLVAELAASRLTAGRQRNPSEALLLAVRAARRALFANPEDAGAFLLLGEAYLRLSTRTREQNWQAILPSLAAVRREQTLTALEQAVLLRPELDQAHALLADLYTQARQWDRALDHLRARLQIAEQQLKDGSAKAVAAEQRRLALQADVQTMQRLVRRAEEIYAVNTEGQTDPSRVVNRAQVALRHGLARKALEMLLASHPAIFGTAGVDLQLDLMLKAGRAYEVRAWLEPQHEHQLGASRYHSLQAQAAAACGDYAAADAELDALCQPLRSLPLSPQQEVPVRSAAALRAAWAALTPPVAGEGAAGLARIAFSQFKALEPLGAPVARMRQEADWRVLRGLLALEAGAVETARRHFRTALAMWDSDNRAASGGGLDFPTRPIAQQALGWLDEFSPSRDRQGAV
ncbi:MAG: hypothetical protein ACRELG_23110, partial [Gemmataceae bacterium]